MKLRIRAQADKANNKLRQPKRRKRVLINSWHCVERRRICEFCPAAFAETSPCYRRHLLTEHMQKQLRVYLRRCDEKQAASQVVSSTSSPIFVSPNVQRISGCKQIDIKFHYRRIRLSIGFANNFPNLK